jgi:hypothetical protein
MIILPSWKLPSGGTITKECDGVMNDWLFVVDFFTNFLGGDGETLLSSSELLLTWFLPRRLRLVEFKIGGSVSISESCSPRIDALWASSKLTKKINEWIEYKN